MSDELDLDKPGVLKMLGKQILADIDEAAVEMYNDGPRRHLGASIIGDICTRKLWYGFRWVDYKVHDGRMYRLFNRGHKEEARYCEWLRFKGYEVQDIDPSTGKQWVVTGVHGHFGGSMDGKIRLPPKFNYFGWLLGEFKTNSTGAGFTKVKENSCVIGKAQHFDQQCVYGYYTGLTHSVYLITNKNDDDMYAEVVKLDMKRAVDMEKKAIFVITATQVPQRISESPAYGHCKMCDFHGVCHENKPAKRNCRSCRMSEPRSGKTWYCNKFGDTIPDEFIKTGCNDWLSII